MKRLFDILFSLFILVLLSPLFALIAIFILLDSKGGIFYIQKRVGKDFKEFGMYKFRTMRAEADNHGLLTVGDRDHRITKAGYYLRKYKLDELPQFINVLAGDMSVVGPRPEVKKYVSLYDERQKRVLSVKPGITDYASVEFSNENELLKKYPNPEEAYIREIMPRKLELYLKYIDEQSFWGDMKILIATVFRIIK